MGTNFATDLAENIDISLEQAIGYHLQGNHYPPVPLSMVPVCIQAIDFAHEDLWDETIEMPDGISYKGLTAAPVWAIIEQHHLHAWLPQEDDFYGEEDNGYELGLGLE
jgi:hypothetical protein